jgi:hypothetical protein
MAIVIWWESVGQVALPWVALTVERWALVMGVWPFAWTAGGRVLYVFERRACFSPHGRDGNGGCGWIDVDFKHRS